MRLPLLCFSVLFIQYLTVQGLNRTKHSREHFAPGPQHGSASELKPNLKQPWPLVSTPSGQLRIIKYCYHNAAVRALFHCRLIQPALSRWATALGFPASAETGHNLAWKEADNGQTGWLRKHEYCSEGADDQWNPRVEPGTLWIHEFLGNPRAATGSVGWDARGQEPHRHDLELGVEATVDDVVHELGHVLGMVHEMTRSDRDTYVLYQCQNVIGYREALKRAMADSGLSEEETSMRLCEDFEVALHYDFMGQNFIKSPDGIALDDGEWDYDSIMLYSSDGFGSVECATGDKKKCPLLRYVRPGHEEGGVQKIPRNVNPSAKDVQWVKKWYPWVGDEAEPASELRRPR